MISAGVHRVRTGTVEAAEWRCGQGCGKLSRLPKKLMRLMPLPLAILGDDRQSGDILVLLVMEEIVAVVQDWLCSNQCNVGTTPLSQSTMKKRGEADHPEPEQQPTVEHAPVPQILEEPSRLYRRRRNECNDGLSTCQCLRDSRGGQVGLT